MKDIEKLAEYSQMAKGFKNYRIIDALINEDSFHPNGNCGCIELDDEYMFGIRCNHLMWAEGEFEDDCEAIFIYGNHKGWFYTKMIVESDTDCDEDEFYINLIKRVEPNINTCEIYGFYKELDKINIMTQIVYYGDDVIHKVDFHFEYFKQSIYLYDSDERQSINILAYHKGDGTDRFYIYNHSGIIDDANGFGYKTLENAERGYKFKKNKGFVS